MHGSQLRYVITPGTFREGGIDLESYEKIYAFWRSLWNGVFTELNFPTDRLADDFFRQTIIASIFSGDEVIAAHLYTVFDTRSACVQEHTYIKNNYTNEFWKKMQEWDCNTFMSMEYFSVSHKWRKSNSEVPIAAVVAGLGLKVMYELGVDAAIAPARQDYKVNQLAYTFGADCVVKDLMNHNVACDLIAFRKGLAKIDNGNSQAFELIKKLWATKEDFIFEKNNVVSIEKKTTFKPEIAA
jgi:hypothetical protein